MFTQVLTFYKDHSIKTYTELLGDVVLLYEKYDKKGNVLYHKNEIGHYIKTRYDKQSREIYRETNIEAKKITDNSPLRFKKTWFKTSYDSEGRVISQRDNRGEFLIREFNSEGRLVYEETSQGVTYNSIKRKNDPMPIKSNKI